MYYNELYITTVYLKVCFFLIEEDLLLKSNSY